MRTTFDRKLHVARLAFAGDSPVEIAKVMGVKPRTIRAWLREPAIQKELARWRSQVDAIFVQYATMRRFVDIQADFDFLTRIQKAVSRS